MARRALVAVGVAAAVLACGAAWAEGKPWVQDRLDEEAVRSVWLYLRDKDCAGAVTALNAGVGKQHPSVLLLAGGMFEDGVCLKPNWARAVDFYLKAHQAGHPRAASRLASGYLTTAAGPDKAAGLWWALRAKTALPPPCAELAAEAGDADRFVAVLKGWPSARLDACTYVAGVVSTVNGDVEFSNLAKSIGLKGSVKARFTPATGSFEIAEQDLEQIRSDGTLSGVTAQGRPGISAIREFERDILAAGKRAVSRYVRPAEVDPTWSVVVTYSFDYVWR